MDSIGILGKNRGGISEAKTVPETAQPAVSDLQSPSLHGWSLAAEPADELAEPDPLPTHAATPEPCPACGCPLAWEDLAGRLHCCECIPIPARRMAKDAWVLMWRAGRAVWEPHEFRHWNPYGHIEAAERAARAAEDDAVAF